MYESESGEITLTLGGDAMISRALKPFREPKFLELRDVFHAADAGIINGEILFHNYEDWPTYLSQTYMRCDPRFIEDLRWFGVSMLGCANNHGTDYGETGVLTNIRYLDQAGMQHAGSGENYAQALAPTYLDTPKGRVALISATSSARANSRAGEQRADMKGRPGVNLIRWINEWTVDGATFEALEHMAQRFRWRQTVPAWLTRAYGLGADSSEQAVYLQDRNLLGVGSEDPVARFLRGDGFQRHTRAHQLDIQRNLQNVSDARRMADWVVFSMHSHEGAALEEEPADHVRDLAHAVIDAGADIFLGHGPHIDRGVEIYNGKPIFYSLGQLIVQNDTVALMPQESMILFGMGHDNTTPELLERRRAGSRRQHEGTDPHSQSAVATVSLNSKGLCELKLYPIEFGEGLPRSQSGRPILSEGASAQENLERFQRLSRPYGTNIAIEGTTGVIRP
ncbi:MAG TPA: CapA family protein [Dehalococcoidia bacterium]|nr:CapA family protein [Dehalococcoidia bacterium]